MAWLKGVILLSGVLISAIPTDKHVSHSQVQHVLASESPRELSVEPRPLKGRFLHVTDFHPDPFYKVGTKAKGKHPCHKGKGHAETGYYGAPTTPCDSPLTLVDDTFEWIEKNIKDEIDFVIWTGDSARHDNDNKIPRTRDQVEGLNKYVVKKFVDTFGQSKDAPNADPTKDFVVPIVPTFGNNDILPHNIFLPGPNTWTRSYLDIWSKFIPEAQVHSFARGGWFWTEVIPHKLAVISVNSLYFFDSNSAVLGCDSQSEPGYEQLEWLRIQLQFMREDGIKAFVIGHVPPARMKSKRSWDESCYQKYILWLRQYRDVIVSSFWGHMNVDHFMLHDIHDSIYDLSAIEPNDHQLAFNDTKAPLHQDLEATVSAPYLNDLRWSWKGLPIPPKGLTAADMARANEEQTGLDTFLSEVGGPFGERFSMSFVGPSIVPNYFPSLRVLEYNITGLENDHPAVGPPQGHLATEKELKNKNNFWNRSQLTDPDCDESDDVCQPNEADADGKKKKKKKNKKKKNKKNKKKPRKNVKPDFPVPLGPSKTAPPGPAYSPQTFSLLSWTQLYANLTSINAAIASNKSLLVENEAKKSGRLTSELLEYKVAYTTNQDGIYNMTDLTTMNWLFLAKDMSQKVYKANGHSDEDADDNDVDSQVKNRPYGKLKDNKIWREFVRRAFVYSSPDEELDKDFG